VGVHLVGGLPVDEEASYANGYNQREVERRYGKAPQDLVVQALTADALQEGPVLRKGDEEREAAMVKPRSVAPTPALVM
jgi:hypothetical protein